MSKVLPFVIGTRPTESQPAAGKGRLLRHFFFLPRQHLLQGILRDVFAEPSDSEGAPQATSPPSGPPAPPEAEALAPVPAPPAAPAEPPGPAPARVLSMYQLRQGKVKYAAIVRRARAKSPLDVGRPGLESSTPLTSPAVAAAVRQAPLARSVTLALPAGLHPLTRIGATLWRGVRALRHLDVVLHIYYAVLGLVTVPLLVMRGSLLGALAMALVGGLFCWLAVFNIRIQRAEARLARAGGERSMPSHGSLAVEW